METRTSFSIVTHVQGIRLNYTIFAREERLTIAWRLRSAMMLSEEGYEQEVHHGPYSAADSACGPFVLGPGGITVSGGRHGDRPSHPAPPRAYADVWTWGRHPAA